MRVCVCVFFFLCVYVCGHAGGDVFATTGKKISYKGELRKGVCVWPNSLIKERTYQEEKKNNNKVSVCEKKK